MYHFVQVKEKQSGKKTWYFEPDSEEQVVEHFNKIFRPIIKEGIHDHISNPSSHPSTEWRKAVEIVYSSLPSGKSFVECSLELENVALNTRIKNFKNGLKFYLPNGVSCYILDERFYEIVDKIDKDTLEYPRDAKDYCFENVRFLRWGDNNELGIKGVHWYAKIFDEDIRDVYGNMKWNTKEEAEKAAKRYCESKNKD